MNESTQKVLLFLGGLALGTLGASMLNKHSSSLRPAMTGLTIRLPNLNFYVNTMKLLLVPHIKV